MAGPVTLKEGVTHLWVRVTPKASRNQIQGLESDADGVTRLKVQVTTVPEKGKANQAVIKLLSKELGLAKSAFTLIDGDTSRNKRFSVAAGDLVTRLQALGVRVAPPE